MIFPDKLNLSNTIATTAVSCGCADENDILRLENSIKKLKEYGFNVKETRNVRTNNKLDSSTPKERAEEFMELLENSEVKVIIATNGGEILMDMLPYLDIERIKKSKPKWIQGYSDPSLLNYFITTNFNIATINSVNFKSFGMENWHECLIKDIEFLKNGDIISQNSFDMFESARVKDDPYAGYALSEKVQYKSLYSKEDTVKGRIIGGCIDVISLVLGTKFDNTVNFCKQFDEGMLWYIDNCELNMAGFYRTIWQMKQAGWFNNARGFLIGRTPVEKEYFDFNYLDSLHKAFDDLNVPVFYDVDIGHLPPQWTMINGSLGEFKYLDGRGELVQKMV